MQTYPIRASKADWRRLEPERNTYYTEEYTASKYDLYLTDQLIRDDEGKVHCYYRLHARYPHSIEQALAYDIKCPRCGRNLLKQVGRCRSYYTLGLYVCPACDRNRK